MNEEIREVLAENEAKRNKPEQAEQTINPLDYVTIPIKEYRKLIKKVAKLKHDRDEQRHQKYEYYRQVEELRKTVDAYKNDIRKLVGLDELKKVGEQDAKS